MKLPRAHQSRLFHAVVLAGAALGGAGVLSAVGCGGENDDGATGTQASAASVDGGASSRVLAKPAAADGGQGQSGDAAPSQSDDAGVNAVMDAGMDADMDGGWPPTK